MVKQWPIKTMQQYTKVLVLLSVILLPVLDASKSIDASSATCDDVICCPGRVCDDSNGRPRCNMAASCADVDCPDGLRCVEGQRPQCVVPCDYVLCPTFLQCVMTGSSAACGLASDCDDVECPFGTTCMELYDGGVACLGTTCDTVDCGSDGLCGTVSSDDETTPRGTRDGSSSKTRSNSRSRSMSRSRSIPDESAAVCLPLCTERVCPFGLVCEETGTSLICRLPTSCDELICPEGTMCEETECSNRNNPSRSRSRGTRHRSRSGRLDSDTTCTDTGRTDTMGGIQIIVRCVAVSSTMAIVPPSADIMEGITPTMSILATPFPSLIVAPSTDPLPPDRIIDFDEDVTLIPTDDDNGLTVDRIAAAGGTANVTPTLDLVGVVILAITVLLALRYVYM